MANRTVSTAAMKRSTWVAVAVFAVFAVLLIRILLIQTVNFEKYQSKVINQMTTESPVAASRGKIYDRNGNVLATNITTYRVFISPSSISSASGTEGEAGYTDYASIVSKGLSEILGVDYSMVYKQATGYTQYLDRTIQRKVTEETADKVREFAEKNKLADMIYLEAQSTRYYPGNTLGAHVIGFTSGDGIGLYGLEYQYEEYLGGTDGYYILARDSYGKEMPYEYASYIDAIDGYNLTTTIDASVQAYLEEQLAKTVADHKIENRATGIVMDVNTGAILAMATSSPFDLNDPWALSDEAKRILAQSGYEEGSDEYEALLSKTLTEAWSNKAVAESYIPGSTFKIITSAMALEEGKVENDATEVNCPGYKKVLGIVIHCHKVQGHGGLTFAEGLQQSCNVWFMTLGERIGISKFVQYTDIFGYREKTGIDLPGEGNSIFIKDMSGLDLAIYAFGQNFNVTPIQQITAISSIANGGSLVTPYLVEKITDNAGNVIYSHSVEVKRETVSEDVCETISKMLEEGVSGNGGAKNAYVAGYKVAAKTGTSEKKKSTYDFAEAFASAVSVYVKRGGKAVDIYNKLDPENKLPDNEGYYDKFAENAISFAQTYYKELAKEVRNGNALKSFFTQNQINGMIALADDYEKEEELYICSTVAYAPADDPQVAIIIIADEPTKGVLYGSTVAAPYVSDALENILPHLGITPEYTEAELKKLAVQVGSYRTWTVSRATTAIEKLGLKYEIVGNGDKVVAQYPSSGKYVEKSQGKIYLYTESDLTGKSENMSTVPDFTGMTAAQANGLIINLGLNIKIEGTKNYLTGTDAVVYSQSIAAGTKVVKGEVITLTFRYMDGDEAPDYRDDD